MKTKTLLLFVIGIFVWHFSAAQTPPEAHPGNPVHFKSAEPYFVLQVGEQSVGIDKEDKTFDIKAIDPEGIKEIQVFKDKNATDKYGDKGKDGVVLIVFKDSYKLPENIRERFEKSK